MKVRPDELPELIDDNVLPRNERPRKKNKRKVEEELLDEMDQIEENESTIKIEENNEVIEDKNARLELKSRPVAKFLKKSLDDVPSPMTPEKRRKAKQAAATEAKPVRVEEKVIEPIWYPEIGKDLFDLTRNKPFGNETPETLELAKKNAKERLEKSGVKVEEFLRNREEKAKVYWASRILNGEIKESPWISNTEAIDYLAANFKIVKPLKMPETVEAKPEEKKRKEQRSVEKPSKKDFNAKWQEIDKTNGNLVEGYKAYLRTGVVPENMDNIKLQLRKVFSFDLDEFAKEYWSANKSFDEKKEAVKERSVDMGWQEELKTNEWWNKLQRFSNSDKWAAKVKELGEMDEKTREEEVKLLIAAMKIKDWSQRSEKVEEFWNWKKGDLQELGVI